MNRTARLSVAVLILAIVLLTVWMVRRLARERAPSSSFGHAVQSALTNPVEFAKNRVTGGVGLLLVVEPGTGRPMVQGVGVGSPAEAAGLHVGDVIMEVNRQAITNQSLRQVVETFRGFTGGKVDVTVRRAGITNLSFVIRRASWNTLLKTTFAQRPGTNK
jgi:C-terminal processing protease CtpA/Prc